MQFEENDKRIREAAEQHHPPYDDKAWNKMERLLDKEMPQEKERRRPFILFFLLFALLAGGIAILLMQKPWQDKNADEAYNSNTKNSNAVNIPATNDTPAEQVQDQKESGSTSVEIKGKDVNNPEQPSSTKNTSANSSSTINTIPNKNNNTIRPLLTNVSPKANESKKQSTSVYRKTSNKQDAIVNMTVDAGGVGKKQKPVKDEVVLNNVSSSNIEKNDVVKNTEVKTDQNLTNKQTTDEASTDKLKQTIPFDDKTMTVVDTKKDEVITNDKVDTKTAAKKKAKASPLSKLGFSFSAGPDVSKAGSSTIGKVNMLYGFGVSYDLGRFAIRTGVYSVKKVYQANASSYKLSYQLSWGTKFLGADANCKVMAVPVAVTYNFKQQKKHNWFIGAGATSYFMKKEVYNYQYKNAAGALYSYKSQLTNKNKHYLSVLDISVGYGLKLSNKIAVSASPYLQVPLTGIGEGKVHLNSGGVLFTVGVKPFAKK